MKLSCGLVLLASVQLLLGASLCVADDCADPCSCQSVTWAGKFDYPINFTQSEQGIQYSYSFSPCATIPCGSVSVAVVMCQYDPSGDAFVVVGTGSKVQWNVVSSTDFTVVYGGGTPTWDKKERMAVLSVNVTDIAEESTIKSAGEDDSVQGEIHYLFNVSISTNVPSGGAESPVGIAGVVIMFLMLAALVTYFVIGGIVMYTVKGARGVEVIPQYAFWKELPFLIKDGVVFTLSPCLSKCGNKSTYSSLG